MRTTTFGVAAALWLLAVPALAQQPTQQLTEEQRSALDDEARQLFEAGEVAYQNGRYESAYQYFAQSYELSHRALILYNMGLSAELARLDREALEAYRGYLEAVPSSDLHNRVRTRVEVLEQRVSEGDGGGSGGGSGSEGGSGSGGGDPLPGWLLFGGGIAVAVTGGVLLGVAASDVSRVENAPMDAPWADYEESARRAEPMSIAGGVMLGVGVAAAGLGIVLALTSSGGGDEVAVRVSPNVLALEGSFQ